MGTGLPLGLLCFLCLFEKKKTSKVLLSELKGGGKSKQSKPMDDIFTQCREGNSVAVRLWLDNTENDLNLG